MIKRIVIDIYDRFRRRPAFGASVFVVITVALTVLIMRLNYKEDISDFLPMDAKNRTALSVYQDVSGANKIFAIVASRDTTKSDADLLIAGADSFMANVESKDSLKYVGDIMGEVDMDKMLETMDLVYENIPYFLTEKDYARIDSLLTDKNYISERMKENKEMLLFPTSNVMADNISRDPLNLFSPVAARLRQGGIAMDFELHDGHILTPDGSRAIVMMESSFGAHESENNAGLVSLLEGAAAEVENEIPGIEIHIIGGPVIAVGNADRIKKDSILAVSIAGVLIMLLLIYVFRNLRNILLILVSVGWGWLFAMGAIALYYDSVSIIVIGIASVILGIAVNYPLHLIDHLKGSVRPREALKEIVAPLVVGNVTTVGAFLCLVPLNSPALHDLGLFASLLLIGTIFFVLVFLPQVVKTRRRDTPPPAEPRLIAALADVSVENSRWMVWLVLLLTGVFGYFSLRTEFDTDMRNINYMTPEQKEDMLYFSSLTNSETGREDLYVVGSGTTWNEALLRNETLKSTVDSLVSEGMASRRNEVSSFLVSAEKQRERLNRWERFVEKYRGLIQDNLRREGEAVGFNAEAFLPFEDIMRGEYEEKDVSFFKAFVSELFPGSVSEDTESGRRSVVELLSVPSIKMEEVKSRLGRNREFGGLFFDVKSMNGSIANTLSDDFNYIGLVCGCIVFLFLWISLGRIELAVVSFMPMAFSWIWILGIMGMLGIKFNIVNVILATFIFGQGDDYTIFMTEGLSYEYAYRRRLLASYKGSIIVSALIMFIGIGTLLFAQHPALRSLGEVTVVGMLSVVLMAYLFPPLMFHWLVRKKGKLRLYPLTIGSVWRMFCRAFSLWMGFIFGGRRQSRGRKRLRDGENNDIPGNEDSEKPVVVVGNKGNLAAILGLAEWRRKMVVLLLDGRKYGCLVRSMLKWRGIILKEVSASDDSIFEEAVSMAERFNMPIVPMYVVYPGVGRMVERYISEYDRGEVKFGNPVRIEIKGEGAVIRLRDQYFRELRRYQKGVDTVENLIPLVCSQYLYKGRDFVREVRKSLESCSCDSLKEISLFSPFKIGRYGEIALMAALLHPDVEIECEVSDADTRSLLLGCAEGLTPNLNIMGRRDVNI